MCALPFGTVTFLFTDIEGSTDVLRQLGTDAYEQLLTEHSGLLRDALSRTGVDGRQIRVEGDSFFVAFQSASQAVAAAVAAQRAFATHAFAEGVQVRIRMGLHTGEGRPAAAETGADYVGIDVHRAARIGAVAYGGQIIISESTWALVRDALPAGVTARDLGSHRFKDFEGTERIHQLVIDGLRADFPPLRSIEAAPNNLPLQLTTFIGRERIGEVASLLRNGTRLLTLTGPGGAGKTRLSIEAASDLVDEFPDGVYWVPLAAIADADLVGPAIASSLGLYDASSQPTADRVAEHLRDKTALLVIDNFEQLLPAAPLVGELLRAAARLRVITSSRAPLRITGEQEFPVRPLTLAEPGAALDELAHSEAVSLFVERATAVRPNFEVSTENARSLAEICVRLDGLPLAIELAAARVKLLPPEAILQRLGRTLDLLSDGSRDLPDRQRTLRGTIGWSYDLLDGPARTLFARLAVFAEGGFLREIEGVCGVDALQGLTDLVDHSLLHQREVAGEPRLHMLVTIREYALEQLDGASDAELIRRRHAGAYLELAARIQGELMGPKQRELLDRLERDHDNLRAATEWAIEHDHALAMRLVGSTWRFWHMRGHLNEAETVAERVLALPHDDLAPERLSALEGAGGVAYWRGDMQLARRHYREALDIATRLGDRAQVAAQAYNLSFSYQVGTSDVAQGLALGEQALDAYRELGDRAGVAKALGSCSYGLYQLDELARARIMLDECIALLRELDDRFGLAWALEVEALINMKDGQLDDAQTSFAQSLRLSAGAGDLSSVALVLMECAILAALRNDLDRAVRLFAASEKLRDESGTQLAAVVETWQLPAIELIHAATQQLGEAREEGHHLSHEQAIALALGDDDRS